MNDKILYIKVLFILMMIIWCLGILSNVLLPHSIAKVFPGIFLNKIYSIVCHQDTAKSFFISGDKLEVCARCTGIYTGGLIFAVIALLFPRMKPQSKKLFFMSMIPITADVLSYSFGLYDYSKWIAYATGLILGSVSILYIFTGIDDYFFELKMSSNVR